MPTIFAALTGLAALVTALPSPQDAGHCFPLAPGYGPVPAIDSAEAFQASEVLSSIAESAITPPGYVNAVTNLNMTYSENAKFDGYYELKSYDVKACAKKCNSHETCNAFQIFFERSPSIAPGAACPDPASTTRIKCDLWTATITEPMAMNEGQYQMDFHVVMTGSNAYVKDIDSSVVPEVPGFETGVLPAGIEAPLDCQGQDTYLEVTTWDDGKLNIQRCIDTCATKNGCHFVNTFLERFNGIPIVQHCALYTSSWSEDYATNYGQHRGGVGVDVTNSYSFTHSNGSYAACVPV